MLPTMRSRAWIYKRASPSQGKLQYLSKMVTVMTCVSVEKSVTRPRTHVHALGVYRCAILLATHGNVYASMQA